MNDLHHPEFEQIFNWAPGIFLVLLPDSPKFTIVAANQARYKATMSDSSQIGKGLFEMFPDNPDDPHASGVQNLRHSLEQVLKTRKPDTMAVQKYDIPKPEFEGGGYEERYWSPLNSPVLDKDGKVLYIIHQVEDVTEFVRLKQQGSDQLKLTTELQNKIHKAESEVFLRAQEIQKANLKLQKAHEEMQNLYAKVKDLDKMKTQLFANVSHELRTPLALILGPVEQILNNESISKKDRANLKVIQRNAQILLKHVNDILDVAKLEAGKMTMSYSEFNLAKFIRLTASSFESVMASKSIHFSVKSPEVLKAQVDEEKIQRILMNLLSNAMKFVPQGGRVECSIKRLKEQVILTVQDNGPGIRPELREAVFERFRQVEGGATRSVGGTGLGLAIVKDFVELHHGSISITDTAGGGATFNITLPIYAPAGVHVKKVENDELQFSSQMQIEENPATEIESTDSFNNESPVVLVVEDNSDMREFISTTLREKFQVIRAENGLEGLKKIKTLVPDIILTDIMMPKMSGDQMIREIRKNPAFNDIPIILLTAKMDYDLKLSLLGNGCQDFLSKPFSQKELLIRVNNLVAMKKAKEILSSELSLKSNDIFSLSRELTLRKRELQDSLETTSVAKEQAEMASEMKSRLLTMVSHELRTPLTTLMLTIEMIQKKNPIAKDSPHFQNVMTSSLRLKELIDQLIEYANFQSRKLVSNESWVHPHELIKGVVEEMSFSAKGKGLELIYPETRIEPVMADSRLLKVILYNFISNAIKFTKQGRISVNAFLDEGTLNFEVKDSGPGIPQEDLQSIFEPFKQLEALNHKGSSGVGLGLAFVKGIVDSLKGTCTVESELGRGSTFKITIPVFRSQHHDSAVELH